METIKRPRKKREEHRMSYSVEYAAWKNILARTTNECHPLYKRYYIDRGIQVSDTFKNSFLAFLAEVGFRPGPEYSIDRIRGELGYVEGNLKWSNGKEQQRNRPGFSKFVEYMGVSWQLCRLAEYCGVNQKLLRVRIFRYGWPVEKAVDPTNHNRKDGTLKKYN